jgi:CSLREA domain-containing protein
MSDRLEISTLRRLAGLLLVSAHAGLAQQAAYFVKDTVPGALGGVQPEIATLAGKAYFSGSGRLWTSDGTPEGTAIVSPVTMGPFRLTATDSLLFFNGYQASTGQELWRSDGTEAGTSLVKDVWPGAAASVDNLSAVGSTLFFRASQGTPPGQFLWKSDGTNAGTVLVKNVMPDSGSLTAVGSRLFFTTYSQSGGHTYDELWVSDGTTAGTLLVVASDRAYYSPEKKYTNLTAVGGTLFFGVSEVQELWTSDGTAGGTGPVSTPSINFLGPMTSACGVAYFVGYPPTSGQGGVELYRSDGSGAGTYRLKDIYPGTTGEGIDNDSSPSGLRAFGCSVFLTADDGAHGREPWVSDGTGPGTLLLGDIRPGAAASAVANGAAANGLFYFLADDGSNGLEPWVSDGTPAGTHLLRDIRVGGAGSAASGFAPATAPRTVFVADDGVRGAELWVAKPPGNSAPVAVADAYQAIADIPLQVVAPGVLGNDSDGEEGTLTVTQVTTQPAHAASFTSAADGAFLYTPAPGFTGADGFVYLVDDGQGAQATANVSIDVRARHPGIVVAPTGGLTTTEGGVAATFDIVLDDPPTADVVLSLSSSDPSEGTVVPPGVTFTPGDWSVARAVTITGVDDAQQDDDVAYTVVTGAATSTDLGYDALDPSDVSVTNVDDEIAVTAADDLDDGACRVAHCSLREAILKANALGGARVIRFALPGAGPWVIQPTSALPAITASALVDGATQPGFGTAPVVEIDGSVAPIGTDGLVLTGSAATVRALVIRGFRTSGGSGGTAVVLAGTGGHHVEGCYLGVGVTGATAAGNYIGVVVASSNNQVGGSGSVGNVIAASVSRQIEVEPGALDNSIVGNALGVDATGNVALPAPYGIYDYGTRTRIGGVAAGEGNVVASNFSNGIGLTLVGSGAVVEGNFFGVSRDGNAQLRNNWGILAAGTGRVGGSLAGQANQVAYSREAGILARGAATRLNRNQVHHTSAGLAVDLSPSFPNGVTANDPGDADTGPNGYQNFPVLTAATTAGGVTTVSGTFESKPSRTYRLEFFSSPACSASGHGEAQVFLGDLVVATAGPGTLSFSVLLTPGQPGGWSVSATAIDEVTGETSELSSCQLVTALESTPPTNPTLSSSTHVVGTWSSSSFIAVQWTGAADEPGGSGLAGYSIVWDSSPSTTPDTVIEIPHTSDPDGVGASHADGSSHYFHLRTCDNVGNCASAVHAGPFWIDATAPTAPGGMTSASHGDGLPHSDRTVDLVWGAATDAASGIASYGYVFDATPTGACTGDSTTSTSASSPPLGDGIWYAHVCAVDAAGNPGPAAHGGPFVVGPDPAWAASLVSHQAGGATTTGNGASSGRFVSADGRYVAFSSSASDLHSGTDTNGVDDAFLWDRVTGDITLVSHLAGDLDTTATGAATAAGISSDGAWVAFYSTAPDMIAGGTDTNGVYDAFLWERATGAITLLSHAAGLATTAGDETSYIAYGTISADGQRVAIYSDATNLVVGGTDVSATTDALLWDGATGLLTYMSHLPGAPTVAAQSYSVPTLMSTDGEYVTFYSQARNLVSGDVGNDLNGGYDAFLWERATGAVVLASHVPGSTITSAESPSSAVGLSADGRYLLLSSSATDLVVGFSNANGAFPDVFLYDRLSTTVELASRSTAGPTTTGNSSSYGGGISADGRYVLLTSGASDLVSGVSDVNGAAGFDVFVRDRVAGTTTLLTHAAGSLATTANDESVAFALSSDGRYALYKSLATDLVAGMTAANGAAAWDVFRVDRLTGVSRLITHSAGSPTTTGNAESLPTGMTPSGSRVLFESGASDLVAGLTDADGTGLDLYFAISDSDSTAPADPTITATDPPASIWSSDSTVELTWSGASDEPAGSGLAGYSVLFDHSATSSPDQTVDVPQATDPHSFTSTSLADASDWYAHVATCDLAGNCTTTVHAGPFMIDTLAPSAPVALTSASHAPGVASTDTTVDLTWSPATDAGSGVSGFSWLFDHASSSACETTVDGDQSVLAATSPALAGGVWYAHVCALDGAGNWGAVAHRGPFTIDTAGSAATLFWTATEAPHQLGVAQEDGSGVTVVGTEGASGYVGVDVDAVARKVYWTSWEGAPESGWLRRSDLDGSNVETLVGGLATPHDVAVDPSGGKVYWSERSAGLIRRANLDGTDLETVASGLATPIGVSLDLVHGRIYWTEFGASGRIGRANLDGSGAGSVATGLTGGLHGIWTSASDGRIYFTTYSASQIRRIDYDGNGLVTLTNVPGCGPSDIELDAVDGMLYYPCRLTSSFRKSNLDGTGSAVLYSVASKALSVALLRSDATPPGDPSIAATSPLASTWSNDNTVDVSWSGASDGPGGSGLAGYSVLFDHLPSSAPDSTVDVLQTTDPHSTTSGVLTDAADWYAHVATCDLVSNCTSTVHAGPFWIDTTAPSVPGTVTSSTHGAGPSAASSIAISWVAATDALSGVDGYSVRFDNAAGSSCALTKDVEESTLAATSATLADGTWYAHVCAVDHAGNWGEVANGGPYVVVATAVADGQVFYTSYSSSEVLRVGIDGAGATTIVSGQGGVLGVAWEPVSRQLYWATSAGVIRRSNADGSGVTEVLSTSPTPIFAVALDAAVGKIYWTMTTVGRIERANLDGSGREIVASDLTSPIAIDLDALNGKVYWTEDGLAGGVTRVARANLDGTGIETVFGLPQGRAYGLAVDPVAQVVYWSNTAVGGGTIRRVGYDGTGDVALANGSAVADIAVGGNHIYWVEENGQVVRRAEKDGSNPVTLASGGSFWGVAVSAASDAGVPSPPTSLAAQAPHVPSTWSDDATLAMEWSGAADAPGGSGLAGYSVVFDHSAGTHPDESVDVPQSVDPHTASSGVLADAGDWYVHVRACDVAGNCGATVHAGPYWVDATAPSPPGAVTSASHGAVAIPDPTIDASWLAASDAGSSVALYRYAFTGSAPSPACASLTATTAGLAATSAPLADGSWYLHVCAEDLAGNRSAVSTAGPFSIDSQAPAAGTFVYFSRYVDQRIDRLAADGSGRTTVVPSGSQTAVDVDPVSNHVYYVSGSLRRASLDGSNSTHVASLPGNAYAIAVSTVHDRVVWTSGAAIRSMRLDGSGFLTLASGNIGFAADVEIDERTGTVYWADYNGHRIERVELDGSGRAVVLATGSLEPYGLALRTATNQLFWTAANTGEIRRVGLDGTGDSVIVPGSGAQTTPAGIDLDVPSGYLFWVEEVSGLVRRARLDGTSVTTLATNPGAPHPYGIAVLSVDEAAPSDPSIVSASPAVETWSNDNTVTVTWSGAADAPGGVGLAGYSVQFDHAELGVPDTTVEVPHHVDPHGGTSSSLSDGDDWYAHLSTCDLNGNCTSTVHAGPFWIDATAPSAPGPVASASHGGGQTHADATIDVAWSGASDTASGVASYRYAFTSSATAPSCASLGSVTASTAATSSALADGTWYAHVCAVDAAGNTSPVAMGGPYLVDTSAPTGLAVGSTSHAASTWSHDPTVDFSFTGAADVNGVSGYSVAFDQGPATVPDGTVHQVGTTFTGAASPDGSDWYVHVRACDDAGNCGATVHAGPFWIDTAAPGAPGAVTSSHDGGAATADATIAAAWAAANDGLSGVDGYAYAFTGSATPVCDQTKDVEESTTAVESAVLADGSWYLHVCAVDNAGNWGATTTGGPYLIDTASPSGLVVSSSSHSGSTWSVDPTVDFAFSGATDASGVAGYSRVFDRSAATVLDATADQAGTSFTGTASPDANDWWLHVRACDAAGNCGSTVHAGPFWIDTTAPSAPGSLTSPSHTVGVASGDPTIEVTWTVATDATSGVNGYAVLFDANPTAACDEVIDQNGAATGATSNPLPSGTWYAHVCAVDTAGSWGAVANAGPYTTDATAPTATSVRPVAGSGSLGEGALLDAGVTQLLVAFSEPMATSGGGSAAAVGNYKLFAAGPNHVIDSTGCGSPAVDDLAVTLGGATYLAASQTAALTLDHTTALAASAYRLLACGSLTDAQSNALDGNADTTPGDDFGRSFTVQQTDLLANPNFDLDTTGWTLLGNPGELSWQSGDADAAPTSGSAQLVTLVGAGQTHGIGQCLPVTAGEHYRARGLTRIASGTAGQPKVGIRIELFASAACTGSPSSTVASPLVSGDTAGGWRLLETTLLAPAGTVSARVRFQADNSAGGPAFTVGFDDLMVNRYVELLFMNGFESGTTGAWSGTVGGP